MPATAAKTRRAFRHASRAAWRKVADEAIILDVESAEYYSLTGPGLRAWELLGEGKTARHIAERLAEEYDAPYERIEADVEALVAELKRAKLVQTA